jgi:hypothetical protein
MWDRRSFLTRAGLGVLGTAGLAFGQPPPPAPTPSEETLPDGSEARGMVTPETQKAIDKGLLYLKNHINPDGSFGTEGRLQLQGNVAITSLAALAFMSAGNQPNRGPYGGIVTRALRYVLDQSGSDGAKEGYLNTPGGKAHGPMYGHGFGTLFLDADISVTVCQIMALRSARNAGIDVPVENRNKCIEYVKKCQDATKGTFKYMIKEPGNQTPPFARTAAGVAALNSAGIYKGEEVEKGLKYLMSQIPGGGALKPDSFLYFYGHYYAAQVMWTARGEYWQKWFPAIRDELITLQSPTDGSWSDPVCQHYGTAMACIILQIPNNYLPILQK